MNPSTSLTMPTSTGTSGILKRKLKSKLECPVCSKTYVPPIFMCRKGHSVCAKCQPKLNECSTCRSPGMPTLRCLQLEEIADLVEFPCRNAIHGCKLTFDRDGMAEHLLKCEYGFKCQICEVWKGPAAEISGHIVNKHGVFPETLILGSQRITVNVVVFKTNFHLVKFCSHSRYDALFWLDLEHASKNRVISCTMRLVSHNPTEASKFSFDLGFPSRDGKLRVTYQGQVLNLKENPNKNHTDFVIPAEIINSYGDEQVTLTLKVAKVTTGNEVDLV